MTRLSVNVNKIATLRNARGRDLPNVVRTALDIVRFGADGITVHPRPDGRHIRREDVYALSEQLLDVEFNIEGYPSADFLEMVLEVQPTQCTLVPDPPDVLTSNAGWVVNGNEYLLETTLARLKAAGIRSSLFVDPGTISLDELRIIKQFGAARVEMYTEAYAQDYSSENRAQVTALYSELAENAHQIGLEVNAGHDLNLSNLRYFVENVAHVQEVSIGHALICDALYLGLEYTVKKYLECLKLSCNKA